MSLLGAGGPKAAMAQATADNDALQAIGIETGGNTQANVAEVEQEAENNIEISSEAEAETSVEDSVIVANNEQNAEVNQANVL